MKRSLLIMGLFLMVFGFMIGISTAADTYPAGLFNSSFRALPDRSLISPAGSWRMIWERLSGNPSFP